MNESLTPPLTRPLPYGLTHHQLQFEDISLERAPDLDLLETMKEVYSYCTTSGFRRTVDAALALYEKKCSNTSFDQADRAQLFAVCLDTALIWENG